MEENEEYISEEIIDEQNKETEEIKHVEAVPVVFGSVINCKKLNIREEPSLEANVLCTVVKDGAVIIETPFEHDDFYKVTTLFGIDGYAMKKFINIKE